MPHSVCSQRTESRPTLFSRRFAIPKLEEKIELNRMPIATSEVMFGTRYATRNAVENRTAEFSASATSVARVRHGTVAITQRMRVFFSDFQNSGSWSRYSKFVSPTMSHEPIPLQLVKARNIVNAIGIALNTAKSRK